MKIAKLELELRFTKSPTTHTKSNSSFLYIYSHIYFHIYAFLYHNTLHELVFYFCKSTSILLIIFQFPILPFLSLFILSFNLVHGCTDKISFHPFVDRCDYVIKSLPVLRIDLSLTKPRQKLQELLLSFLFPWCGTWNWCWGTKFDGAHSDHT